MSKSPKNKGLKNPALAVVASSSAGQKAVDKSIDLGFTLLKIVLVAGTVYYVYYKFTHKFSKWASNSNYPSSNVSDAQAQSRAEAIYTAMYGFGNGLDVVKQNIQGLNYNGFVKVYNAFGIRKAADNVPLLHASEGNLIEWFQDQFDESELAELRFLVGGFF